MRKNVGPRERLVRLGIGTASVALLPFVSSGLGRTLLGISAVAGFATGSTRYCPINQALGINASKEAAKEGVKSLVSDQARGMAG